MMILILNVKPVKEKENVKMLMSANNVNMLRMEDVLSKTKKLLSY